MERLVNEVVDVSWRIWRRVVIIDQYYSHPTPVVDQ